MLGDFQKREKINFHLSMVRLYQVFLNNIYLSLLLRKSKAPNDDWKQWQLTTADLKDYVPADLYDRL